LAITASWSDFDPWSGLIAWIFGKHIPGTAYDAKEQARICVDARAIATGAGCCVLIHSALYAVQPRKCDTNSVLKTVGKTKVVP
jgi:hypothetical protein